MSEIKDLNKKKISELVELAKELGVDSSGKKDELIKKIVDFYLSKEKKEHPKKNIYSTIECNMTSNNRKHPWKESRMQYCTGV